MMLNVLLCAPLLAAAAWFLVAFAIDAAAAINARWLDGATAFVARPNGPRRFLILVATNGEATLPAAVAAALEIRLPPATTMRLCVVGNGIPRLPPAAVVIDASAATVTKPARLNLGRAASAVHGPFDYIVMLDADTIVGPDLIEALIDAAGEDRSGWPLALQPMVLSVAPRHRASALHADAIMHTRWRLGWETTLLRLARKPGTAQRRTWVPLNYAVGACLAVRGGHGLFEGPSEDLNIGYDLSRRGFATVQARTVVITETKETVRQTALRNLVWWEGCHAALARRRRDSHRTFLLRRLEQLRLCAWVPGPGLIVLALAAQAALVSPRTAANWMLAVGALALTSYLTGVGTMRLAARNFWPSAAAFVPTAAWCTVRWIWTCVLPMALLAQRMARTGTTAARVSLERSLPRLGAIFAAAGGAWLPGGMHLPLDHRHEPRRSSGGDAAGDP